VETISFITDFRVERIHRVCSESFWSGAERRNDRFGLVKGAEPSEETINLVW